MPAENKDVAERVNHWEQGQPDTAGTPVGRHTREGSGCTEGPGQVSPLAKCCKYVTIEITDQDLTQQVDKQLLEGPKVQLLGNALNVCVNLN